VQQGRPDGDGDDEQRDGERRTHAAAKPERALLTSGATRWAGAHANLRTLVSMGRQGIGTRSPQVGRVTAR
jgi:hypothetical protein